MINFKYPSHSEEEISSIQWVERYPVGSLQPNTPVEFVIENASERFIDLNKTRLYVKAKVTKSDGTPIAHTAKDYEDVSLVNLPLHIIWAQCDVYFQNRHIEGSGWNGYPYTSYMDVLHDHSKPEQETVLKAQGWVKDSYLSMEGTSPDPSKKPFNTSLRSRYERIKNGKSFDLEGGLFADVCKLDSPILNGVSIRIRLTQSSNAFRLLATTPTMNYKLVLEEVKLMVCEITPSLSYYSQITKQLQTTTAKYPYMKNEMITHVMHAPNQGPIILDNVFQGRIPSKVKVGMVLSSAYLGNYSKNPYNFQNFNLNYINVMVNGMSMPDEKALEPNYDNHCYSIYIRSIGDGLSIGWEEFKDGFNIYTFNIDPAFHNIDQLPKTEGGNVKLELRFAKALTESVTLLVVGSFPQMIEIDATRNILQA